MELYLAVVKCCEEDHLGSTTLITNKSGEVVQRVEYLPTGETFIEQQDTSCVSPYNCNGKEVDEETGLYYYGARYYDPRLSMWLGTDPMQGKYPGISTYAYCMGNPVKFVDPDGRKLKLTSFDTYTDLSVIASTLPRDRISETINNE
jgi:RHS repeat-associated protein